MAQLQDPHRLILQLCSEEHVGLWFIVPHIEDYYRGDKPDALRQRTLEVLKTLLESGEIEAGHPAPNGKNFVGWSTPPRESIARIEREWTALGRAPSIGDIVWFRATHAGMERLKPK